MAALVPADTRIRVITDGKAGDETQCVGVAEAMGVAPEVVQVTPRFPWVYLMPWGPIDPQDAPEAAGSPLAPPFPAIAIGSGRRAVAYIRHLKRVSPATFTVFLKDPRTGAGTADFVWVPAHDRLRGSNVLVTLTSPHRVSAERLVAARAVPDPRLAGLPGPRVAVLIGGPSDAYRFTPADQAVLVAQLDKLASAASLMVTTSRRTPDALGRQLRKRAGARSFVWDGTGENPYVAMLAHADAIVVTADSVNMVGEAVATGAPVLVFEPAGGAKKIDDFLAGLAAQGAVRPFKGMIERFSYTPLDSTPVIAREIASRYAAFRASVPAPT